MTVRLLPYGMTETDSSSKVGEGSKSKCPKSLAKRMPSPEVAAKVGIDAGFESRESRVIRLHGLAG